jgi:protein FRA10AC1
VAAVSRQQTTSRGSAGAVLGLNAFELHRRLISAYNSHWLTAKAAPREVKTDFDVLRENYRFLGDLADDADEWEKQMTKKYYDKLFKEYCIADLTRYQEGKVGMRWRTQQEVFDGKGQFVCGNKHCRETRDLESYEVDYDFMKGDGRERTAKGLTIHLTLC